MCREKTEKEIRAEFIEHICEICWYWDGVENTSSIEKIIGAIFSTLVMLDGESLGIPSFIVAPCPHKDDKEYMIKHGEDYYPYNNPKDIKANISGELHEIFMQRIYEYIKENKKDHE